MWLISRHSDGCGSSRIPLPGPVREALVRWYVGTGSRGDEEASIMLVQQARIGGKWIACDCRPLGTPPPILTPAFLSEAETYYLRRLTSASRPEHHADCPFFRDQATNRITEVRNQESAADPPYGFFEVLRPAPEKLAQRPEEEASDDRTRQASIPRLARLLWRLLENAGLNRLPPLSHMSPDHSISDEFKALAITAGKIEIAPGIELGRALWTHAQALHSNRIYARLRELARHWPRGHAPQAFLTLFAHHVRGSTIHVAGSEAIVLANRVQLPSVRNNPIGGPYLVIVVIGEYPEAHGYAPLRGYAQPILSGRWFIPVDTEFERVVLKALLALRRSFDRRGLDMYLEKPVFDTLTPMGACRPDIMVEFHCRSTGECRRVIIEAMDSSDEATIATKEAARASLALIAPVIVVTPSSIEHDRLEALLRGAIDV